MRSTGIAPAAVRLLFASAIVGIGARPARAGSSGDRSGSADDPCAGVAASLDDLVARPFGVPLIASISSTCRSAIAADPSLDVSRKLEDMAMHSIGASGRLAAVTLCDVRASWAVSPMIRGLASDVDDAGRAICLASLAEIGQPKALQAVDAYLREMGVQGRFVDRAVADAGERSGRVRARAGSVLVQAWNSRANGFDRLANAVCQTPPTAEATRVCDRRTSAQELAWRDEPERRRAWIETGAAVLIGAGLAVGGYVARNDDLGRGIAVTAMTLAGARLFAVPLDNPQGGAYGAALASGVRPVLWVLGGAAGLATGLLLTQSPGNSRAATSITGGVLFTTLSIKAAWAF